MSRFNYLLISFLYLTACQTTNNELARWQQQAERVEIIRDDFGVPHIYGESDADAVFGMLYAQCEDDFARVERNYIWATGRLAEVEGKTAIFSDLRANLYMTKEESIEAYESAPDSLKALCQAFADGVNYFLHTHPEVKPALLNRFEPWFPMFFSEGSIGGDIEQISTRKIADFYGSEDEAIGYFEYDHNPNEAEYLREPRGSNGIAIRNSMTQNGHAMLLINPHTSFYFRPEIHVVSEQGLNAYGAVTWGQFFVYQGFNEKTGWMHTSTFVDFMDEFTQEIVEENGELSYLFGQELRPVEVKEVSLKYKEGDQIKERFFEFYRTHQGPITHEEEGKWTTTRINWDPVNALIQSFTRTKQSNYEGFKRMMDIRRNSSNNTVYADAEGNIAYFHGNFIPKRDSSFDYSKAVDGSNPLTDWQGLHSVDESIHLLNPQTDWIQNCNSTPFTAAASFSPKKADYPFYMAPDEERFRGLHAVRLLSEAKSLSLDGLIDLAYSKGVPYFEVVLPALFEAYDSSTSKTKELDQAIALLKKWDYKNSVESKAMSLAHYYAISLSRARIFSNERMTGSFPNPLSTSAKEKIDMVNILQESVDKMKTDFGTFDIAWGEINRLQRLDGDIDLAYDDEQPSLAVGMASGRWGALASYGSRQREGTKKLYGSSGNSFVAVVEFGDQVKAKSILAGGQASDPSSPHFYDQAEMYTQAQFKEVAYYRADVEKRAQKKYKPGQ